MGTILPEVVKVFFENEVLMKIAKQHNKTIGQVALRFLIQNGIIAIPKSTHKK